jgi:hypothetical protein
MGCDCYVNDSKSKLSFYPAGKRNVGGREQHFWNPSSLSEPFSIV